MKSTIAFFIVLILTTATQVLALDDDMRNMDLGSFGDQQKPARMKINPPSEAPASPRARAEMRATATEQQKPAEKAATKVQRRELEDKQVKAHARLNAAVAKKDFKQAERASKDLEKINVQLRALK
jgi:hypothetical protein